MKTLFRVLALGMFLSMFGAISAFAQDDPESLAALFEKFKVERRQPCGSRDAALATGKKILEKYSNDTENPEVIKYVKDQTAIIEKDDPGCKQSGEYERLYKAKDWAKFSALSKDIINSNSPLALDVMLTLVSVCYNSVTIDKVDTYNADTITYAKQAIQRIEGGANSQTGNWGAYLPFKTKTYPDGKNNALNGLNYMIGWINYNRLGATDPMKKKEGLTYFYKSMQYNGEFKNDWTIYTKIAEFYFDEAARLDKEYRDIRAANNNTETDEAKAKRALAMGYAERGIDAFGRAKQTAVTAKETPKVVEGITKRLSDLYKFRFNLAPTAPTPDLDKFVAGLTSKPMPDPSTEPTPVVEEVAPTTTTTSTTTTPASTTSTTSTTTTKAPATTTTTPAANATTTKTTTPAKKPVTKKKGTR